MSTVIAAVVRKEIPAKTKTYLAFGLWIMEKTMTEEEARNKMIEMFIGCETIDAICEKFEAFNEKEMVEKLVQIHKSLKPKPIKKKTEKKIESPDNIVNELVSLATNEVPENANVNVVPTVPVVPENANVVPENVVPLKPTAEKKKRAAPKAKVVPVVENVVVPVVENVVSEVKTSDVKKKRVVKPKTEPKNAVPSATESVNVVPVIETVVPVVESVAPSVVKAPKKKATPKAKAEVTESVASTEAVVSTEAVKTNAVVTEVQEDKKKRATPKAKSIATESIATERIATESENVVIENEVVTSEVQASENAVPSANAVPVLTEDKKKKPKAEKSKTKAHAVVESPKNDVGVPEEFEDTELVVKEFVYGTKSYYIDEEETIYEQEGLKKIGKLVNGKLVFDSV